MARTRRAVFMFWIRGSLEQLTSESIGGGEVV